MRILVLLALVSLASATSHLKLQCDDGWHPYKHHQHTTCLIIMKKTLHFPDAFKACFKLKAKMLGFAKSYHKVKFVNDLIMKEDKEDKALWFFDHFGIDHRMMRGNDAELPKQDQWMVFKPASDESEIQLAVDSKDVARPFICERPARAEPQRPDFSLQPEDVQISEEMLTDPKQAETPIIVSFNCHAYGLPKPTIEWVMTEQNVSLVANKINTTIIHHKREILRPQKELELAFYELRRDCRRMPCNKKGVVEMSQLIVVGAQEFDFKNRIACVATNEFGSILSREAEVIVTKMEDFPDSEPIYNIVAGQNRTIPCNLQTDPDTASVEWVRVEGENAIPLERINLLTKGGIQMSKATSELIIDFADEKMSGKYMCIKEMHNGHGGRVRKELIVHLNVEKCHAESCDFLKEKEVQVVPGYPAVLSLNNRDNSIIRFHDDIIIECPCFGKRRVNENLRVEWEMPAKAEKVNVIPRFYAMMISNAEASNSGEYKCRCVREEEKSEWSKIDVQVLPSFVPETKDSITGKLGGNATLQCQLPELIPGINVMVTPMRGTDSIVELMEEDEDKYSLFKDGQLYSITINDLAKSDATAHGCRVSVNYFDKWTEVTSFYTTVDVKH